MPRTNKALQWEVWASPRAAPALQPLSLGYFLPGNLASAQAGLVLESPATTGTTETMMYAAEPRCRALKETLAKPG
jgi:hypothetical protein